MSKTTNPPEISKKRPRNVGSKKCGCPFQLKGCQLNDGGWELTVVCGTHNHFLADNLIGYAFPARLTLDEQLVVIEMTEAGSKPREMLNAIKKRNSNNLSTPSTIYNFRAKHRLTKFQGRSQMQQLFKDLDDHGYFVDHKMNPMTKRCTSLFFARPESVELAKCFPEVLVMDCTYKTNMQNLPLLDIVGFTSTMKTFAVDFAYLENEKEESFVWALERLFSVLKSKSSSVGVIMTDRDLALMNVVARVFPQAKHLLCRWHIQTNVLANCKKAFKKNKDFEVFYDDVNDLFNSSNGNVYNQRLENFRKKHKKGVVQYIEEQWLKRYKNGLWQHGQIQLCTLILTLATEQSLCIPH